MRITRLVTEWLLPGLECPCCGEVTFAAPPPGLHAGSVSYGPGLNAAAVLLTAYGNVPPERTAQVIGMLLGAHGITAIEAIRTALERNPWLPPIPGAA